MSFPVALPVLPVAVPLLGAAILAALHKWLPRAAADTIGIAATACNFVVSVLLLNRAWQHTIVYWFGSWYPRGRMVLGITFVVDPAAAGLCVLAAGLTLLAFLFSWRYVDAGANHYHPLMLIFLAAMSGFSLTGDLFNLFVFFELMSTAAFALCGLKTREPAPLQGAFNFAITNTIAAFMVLTGIGLLYAVTGALNMAQIGYLLGSRHDPLVLFACALLTCGFFIKAAIVPFHFWLPDAHAVAPTPVCVLFSGLMVELGLYAVLRIHSVIFQQSLASHAGSLRAIFLALGTLTVLLGGIMCYAEHHLKRQLAFSTISHAGLMLVAMALQGPIAIAGLLMYLFAHALVKSGLFFVSGVLLHRLRTISEPALFGRGRGLRFTAALWFLGALGLAGAPPFLTMLGESLTSRAAGLLGLHWLSYLFIVGGALTGATVLRVGMRVFLGWGEAGITDRAAQIGELPETEQKFQTTPWYLFMPAAICILGSIAAAWVPHLLQWMLLASTRLCAQHAYVQTVYTGITTISAASSGAVHIDLLSSAIRGSIAAALGLLLACSSVFRVQIARSLRLGAFMEGPLKPLRAVQSGHPGDYVMWITVGAATVSGAFVLFLR